MKPFLHPTSDPSLVLAGARWTSIQRFAAAHAANETPGDDVAALRAQLESGTLTNLGQQHGTGAQSAHAPDQQSAGVGTNTDHQA